MRSRDALARLTQLGIEAATTSEAASVLRASPSAASAALTRLAAAGLIQRAAHGLWWLSPAPLDPLKLVEPAAAPFPAYVSLLTALHLHGLVEQVPAVTFAVTLGRTRRLRTCAGELSLHHLAPQLFGGAERTTGGVLLATPEKALVDLAWLAAGSSRLFTALPELELPPSFRRRAVKAWSRKLASTRMRTRLERAWRRLLEARRW